MHNKLNVEVDLLLAGVCFDDRKCKLRTRNVGERQVYTFQSWSGET